MFSDFIKKIVLIIIIFVFTSSLKAKENVINLSYDEVADIINNSIYYQCYSNQMNPIEEEYNMILLPNVDEKNILHEDSASILLQETFTNNIKINNFDFIMNVGVHSIFLKKTEEIYKFNSFISFILFKDAQNIDFYDVHEMFIKLKFSIESFNNFTLIDLSKSKNYFLVRDIYIYEKETCNLENLEDEFFKSNMYLGASYYSPPIDYDYKNLYLITNYLDSILDFNIVFTNGYNIEKLIQKLNL